MISGFVAAAVSIWIHSNSSQHTHSPMGIFNARSVKLLMQNGTPSNHWRPLMNELIFAAAIAICFALGFMAGDSWK